MKNDLKLSLCLLQLCVLSFVTMLLPSSLAQDSKQDYADAHNAARAEVGVGPVKWNETLKESAQEYAKFLGRNCVPRHSHGPYGENIQYSFTGPLSGTEAVREWVDEKEFYNHATNTCSRPHICGHYTQVVWRDTVRFGCAKVECSNTQRSTIIVCHYDPPGNVAGEKPY